MVARLVASDPKRSKLRTLISKLVRAEYRRSSLLRWLSCGWYELVLRVLFFQCVTAASGVASPVIMSVLLWISLEFLVPIQDVPFSVLGARLFSIPRTSLAAEATSLDTFSWEDPSDETWTKMMARSAWRNMVEVPWAVIVTGAMIVDLSRDRLELYL